MCIFSRLLLLNFVRYMQQLTRREVKCLLQEMRWEINKLQLKQQAEELRRNSQGNAWLNNMLYWHNCIHLEWKHSTEPTTTYRKMQIIILHPPKKKCSNHPSCIHTAPASPLQRQAVNPCTSRKQPVSVLIISSWQQSLSFFMHIFQECLGMLVIQCSEGKQIGQQSQQCPVMSG